jgi:hypothetical protein
LLVFDVSQLLREVLQHGDHQGVRFLRARNVPDALLSQLAEETYRHAVSYAARRGHEDAGWLTYADGIGGWWKQVADLTDEEIYRLHRFRSDVVEYLQDRGVAWRENPRSTLLLVREPDL